VTRRVLLSPRPRLVIDTNILLLLIGYDYSFSDHLNGPARSRLLNTIHGTGDLVSPDRFDDLWQFFNSAAHRIVNQHVIAEAYNLGKRFFPGQKELFWKSVLEILNNHGIVEASFAVRDVKESAEYQKILREIGPTDAGLLDTAQQSNGTILTNDGPLQQWASALLIPSKSLNQIGSE
jgi:rRNA-processing protein FCF1